MASAVAVRAEVDAIFKQAMAAGAKGAMEPVRALMTNALKDFADAVIAG